MIQLIYFILCLVIAFIGSNRKFGFWGYFFCSLFLTPFIGALVLVASDPRPKPLKKCPKCSYTFSDSTTAPR
ncbi:MAG: hypothetical protein FDX12_09505 [Chlorobium sp.]|nr:MAG: hypothetical protein FDX12_09505 [Chlorobium sp.]